MDLSVGGVRSNRLLHSPQQKQSSSELRNGLSQATIVYEDNQSAIAMAQSTQFHGRAKHIDIRYRFVREQVIAGTIELKYCRSDLMVADMLTKGLPCPSFEKLRTIAGITSIPEHFSTK